jgi:peptide deformylase
MAVLTIKTYPDDVLKRRAEHVEAVDDDIQRLIDDMAQTMYAAPGIGLAAPQVGVSKRVIVVDVSSMDEGLPGLIPLVNPEITQAEGETELEEGCLSLPGFTTMVKRAGQICVRALDRDGKPIQLDAGGILAIALQHEMDHLEGTLLLDRTSPLKREFYTKKVKKSLAKAG